MNVAPPVEPSNAEVMDAEVMDAEVMKAEVMEAAEQPEWCWRPDCCRTGPGGAHLSRPAKVHSALTALCFDGGFARVLGRVLVNSGSQACARGYHQGVDNGWG